MSPSEIERLLEQRTWLRELCRSLVAGSDAEALAEDTLTVAWQRPPLDGGPLRPWLATVARRLLSNKRRSEARRGRRERVVARPESTLDLTAEAAERAELAERAAAAVRDLPEPYRSVLLLRFFEELSPAAIAKRLGRPAATVRSQLARGLELMRTRLDDATPGGRGAWWPIAIGVGHPPSSLPPLHPTSAALGGLAALKLVTIAVTVVSIAALAFVMNTTGPHDSSAAAAAQVVESANLTAAAELDQPAPQNAGDAPQSRRAAVSTPVVGGAEPPAAVADLARRTTVHVHAVDPSGAGLGDATLIYMDDDLAVGDPARAFGLALGGGQIAGVGGVEPDERTHQVDDLVAHHWYVVKLVRA